MSRSLGPDAPIPQQELSDRRMATPLASCCIGAIRTCLIPTGNRDTATRTTTVAAIKRFGCSSINVRNRCRIMCSPVPVWSENPVGAQTPLILSLRDRSWNLSGCRRLLHHPSMARIIRPWQILVIAAAGWISREQDSVIEYLREENRVLKQQLGGRRLRLSDAQRRRLAAKGKAIGYRVLSEVATIVTPDTIFRWH